MRHCLSMTAVLAAFCSATALAGTINYTSESTPTCTAFAVQRADIVNQRQMGLDTLDSEGSYIGSYEADGFLWNNWEPIDQYKRTLCGRLADYSFYSDGAENDSNKYIQPGTGFEWLISDAISKGFTDGWSALHYRNGIAVMEGEVTHHGSYAGNPWFPHVADTNSPLEGRTMCLYGPWVADYGHGGRPEIHPSEAMWWREYATPNTVYREHRVILMQDNSTRFNDRVDDYVPDMPSYRRPWAIGPRTETVLQSFVVPATGGDPLYIHVYEGRTRNVTTVSNAQQQVDVTGGTQHTLAYNGAPRITVVEHQPDSNLGVVFDTTGSLHDVCERPNGYLQGYVALNTQFGYNVSGGAGYQELVIRHSDRLGDGIGLLGATPKAAPDSGAKTSQSALRRAKVDTKTVRVERVGNRVTVRGDLLIKLSTDVSVAAIEDAEGKAVAHSAHSIDGSEKFSGIRLRDLDLGKEQVLRVRLENGETLVKQLNGLAITTQLSVAPQPSAEGTAEAVRLDDAWRDLLSRLNTKNVARPREFAHITGWTLSAVPQFAARKNGEPSREDSSRIAQWLNAAALEGRNGALSLDAAVVELNWTRGTEQQRLPTPTAARWERTLEFLDAAALRSEDIALHVKDAFGGELRQQRRVWSHALRAGTTAEKRVLIDLVEQLAGIDRTALRAAEEHVAQASDRLAYSKAALRLRSLQNQYRRARRDGWVTPDELTILVGLVREAASDRSPDEPI